MNKNIYEVTTLEFLNDLISKSNGITLIDFYQPTCGPCIMLEPVLEELVEQDLVDVLKVDVAAYPEIGHNFNVRVTPTIVIVKQNQIKEVIKGFKPLEE